MGAFFRFLSLLVAPTVVFMYSQGQNSNKIAGPSNQLAVDIHKKLSLGDENVVFSPLSISTALAMLFYGARGKTAEEMRAALGYQSTGLTDMEVHSAFQNLIETFSSDSAAKKYLLQIANAVLIQRNYPILAEYKNGLRDIYKAIARDADFQNDGQKAIQEINNWVKLKTNGQIKGLLDKNDPFTIMILLNAVYFKGTWKTQFDPRNTKEKEFLNKGLNTERVTVPMMNLFEELPYVRLMNAQVLELPYKSEDISMIILLPEAIDGLARLEQQLTPSMLKDIRARTRKTKIDVTLPKFKLEYSKTLNTVLRELGIRNAFEDNADFTGISKLGPIAVSDVVHKAVIEVNEEGSEASAVTAVRIVTRIGNVHKQQFIANHPFLFFVFDRRNDLILFQGRVNKL